MTRLFPALVPLLLPSGHFLRNLSGLSTLARIEVRTQGKLQADFEGSLLCTHFGLSGPVVLESAATTLTP